MKDPIRVLSVAPDSPLFGYIRPGFALVSVNGEQVEDTIDFRFKIADERVSLKFADQGGRELDFDFDELYADDLGLTLDDTKIRVCKNDCIFCFIDQQPHGMRSNLYIRDEDYRLSFTHGNFITLSNTTDADVERIIAQRLSPLYVSVHATDDKLRRCMLRNERLAPIVPRLKHLGDNGITIHTQVVLCPGINDGPQLERTVRELAALHPQVETLAVVPVGLTKFRSHLPNLRTYERDEARAVIQFIEDVQAEFLRERGTRFVWPADEFYVIADLPFPSRIKYEEMSQFENGIGMAREFIHGFNMRKRMLSRIISDRRVMLFTGASAYPFFSGQLMPPITETYKLPVTLVKVENRFWGESVSVSGLLTGQDMLREARKRIADFDVLVLPPNCLNADNLFLDNLTLEQFERALGKPVRIGQYNLVAALMDAFA